MTQSALTWHPTATVRNTSTLKLRSVLSTLWFRSCEMQRRAILFLQLLIRVISLSLSAPLSQSTMSLTVLRVSKEFMILLMGGSFIIRSSLTVIQTRTQSFHSPPRATTHFSKYAYVYRCRMTHWSLFDELDGCGGVGHIYKHTLWKQSHDRWCMLNRVCGAEMRVRTALFRDLYVSHVCCF